MLITCKLCNTTYNVEEELLNDPEVVVQCNNCQVPLADFLEEQDRARTTSRPLEPPASAASPVLEPTRMMDLSQDPGILDEPGAAAGPIIEPTSMLDLSGAPGDRPPPASGPVIEPTRMMDLPQEPAPSQPRRAGPVLESTRMMSVSEEIDDMEMAPTTSYVSDRPPPAQQAAPAAQVPQPIKPATKVLDVSSGAPVSPAPMSVAPMSVAPMGAPAAMPLAPLSMDATAEGEEYDEGEEEEEGAGFLTVIVPLLVIALFAGTTILLWRLGVMEPLLGAKEKAASVQSLSFTSKLMLTIKRMKEIYPTTRTGEEPVASVPVVISSEMMVVDEVELLGLIRGRISSDYCNGLMVVDLIKALAPKTVGDLGLHELLLLSSSDVPFRTVGQILYTAKSAGFRSFYLGGIAESRADEVGAVRLLRLEWDDLAPGVGGKGLGVSIDPDGYRLFSREHKILTRGDDGKPLVIIHIPKDVEYNLRDLQSWLYKLKHTGRFPQVVTVRPDTEVGYEALLHTLDSIAQKDGKPLFSKLILNQSSL